jgi:hypothetical protein
VGLREVEREQFAPFADASARFSAHDGKEIWTARAQSTGLQRRAMRDFHEKPELYRQDFDDVVQDVVNQLIEGPVRPVRF